MADYYNKMFYLGDFSDMDTNEWNYTTECASDILGAYTQPPLIDVTLYDGTNDGNIMDDDNGAGALESIDFDVGAGTQSSKLDSTNVYNVRVTLGDNSTIDVQATVIQLQTGHVFLTEYANNGTLDNLNIQSVELLSVHDTNYSGFFVQSSVDNTTVVCYCSGTRIATVSGLREVQTLRPGDLVLTQDHGAQPLLGVCSHPIPPRAKDQPVVIAPGALGPSIPLRRLRLSPQHRVLANGNIAARMFGTSEVFLNAKALLRTLGVSQQAAVSSDRYWHLICARHEIIFAEGCAAETLFAGAQAIAGLQKTPVGFRAATQLSNLRTPCARTTPALARQTQFVKRCIANGKPIQAPQNATATEVLPDQSLTVV